MAEKLSTGFINKVNTVGSVKAVMANSILRFFDGAQPADADASEGDANILLEVTINSGVFTPGQADNGLNMGDSIAGVLAKAAAEIWSGLGTAAAGPLPGTIAIWFRWYDNTVTTGADTSSARVDGAIGTSSSYEIQMSNTTIVENNPVTVNSFNFTFPNQ